MLKKHCRLRDIQDIFMGTGLNPDTLNGLTMGRQWETIYAGGSRFVSCMMTQLPPGSRRRTESV